MASPCNRASKSFLLRPANLCTPLENSKITWICQVELMGFASGAKRICQSDYKDLPAGANRICRLDWTFFARNRGRLQRFHQNEKWKSEAISVNDSLKFGNKSTLTWIAPLNQYITVHWTVFPFFSFHFWMESLDNLQPIKNMIVGIGGILPDEPTDNFL